GHEVDIVDANRSRVEGPSGRRRRGPPGGDSPDLVANDGTTDRRPSTEAEAVAGVTLDPPDLTTGPTDRRAEPGTPNGPGAGETRGSADGAFAAAPAEQRREGSRDRPAGGGAAGCSDGTVEAVKVDGAARRGEGRPCEPADGGAGK